MLSKSDVVNGLVFSLVGASQAARPGTNSVTCREEEILVVVGVSSDSLVGLEGQRSDLRGEGMFCQNQEKIQVLTYFLRYWTKKSLIVALAISLPEPSLLEPVLNARFDPKPNEPALGGLSHSSNLPMKDSSFNELFISPKPNNELPKLVESFVRPGIRGEPGVLEPVLLVPDMVDKLEPIPLRSFRGELAPVLRFDSEDSLLGLEILELDTSGIWLLSELKELKGLLLKPEFWFPIWLDMFDWFPWLVFNVLLEDALLFLL